MKKHILIFSVVLATLGLTAFGVMKGDDPEPHEFNRSVASDVHLYRQNVEKVAKDLLLDFVYDIGPRFSPIKKEKMDAAKLIDTFFDEKGPGAFASVKSTRIVVIDEGKESGIRESGFGKVLTEGQLKMLRSFDYSTNFLIQVGYQNRNPTTGAFEDNYASPYLTIVPEKQAFYIHGKDALLAYLNENSKEALINVRTDKLRPAILSFMVTTTGVIENIRLDNHSGYPAVDKKIIELMSRLPGIWKPAENAKGEKVNQELVVFFGAKGC